MPPIILSLLLQHKNFDDLKNNPITESELNSHIDKLNLSHDFDRSIKEKILKNEIEGISKGQLIQFYNYLRIATIASNCKSHYEKSNKLDFITQFKTLPDYYLTRRSNKPVDWIAQTGALIYISKLQVEPCSTDRNHTRSNNKKNSPSFTLEELRPMFNEITQSIQTNKEGLAKTLEDIRHQASLKAFQLLNHKEIQITGSKNETNEVNLTNNDGVYDIKLNSEGSLDSTSDANKLNDKHQNNSCGKRLLYRLFCCCNSLDEYVPLYNRIK